MKSINIFRFLLVSLFPFVAFCRSFTSQNPIVLPTNNNNNNDDVAGHSSVGHGRPTTLATLVKNTLFIILSLEADPYIYLANIGHHECPNTVLQNVPSNSFLRLIMMMILRCVKRMPLILCSQQLIYLVRVLTKLFGKLMIKWYHRK
ncbi:hypothetical protein MTR67_014496 [Solanum verrucosum]|uniref:Uncharacterized protein n=1 Tax=Solanum verrucosum TaxID=315347 RepID=A0AAF0TIY1_SOLVR|nr:hypothetical protein MTR67_014496 [Solanum verrucosum]